MNAFSPQTADVLLGPTALSASGSDAELISVCAAFCDLERAYDTVGGGLEDDSAEPERRRIVAEQDSLMSRMAELPCFTLAGVQAMARALAAWDRELLRDTPAGDSGEFITAHLVEKLLALREPCRSARTSEPAVTHPDADLLAVCSEFRTSEAAYYTAYDENPEATDEEMAALANPIAASWDGMLDRMAQFRATTTEGLTARALALAQHSGIRPGTDGYPFAFIPGEPGGVTGRLLDMLLTDAVRMLGAPAPDPDAGLLALRPEFDRLHAEVVAFNQDPTDDDTTPRAFDNCCRRIMALQPALTSQGRALQAAAAMHQLYYRLTVSDERADPVWLMLKSIAGGAYAPQEVRP